MTFDNSTLNEQAVQDLPNIDVEIDVEYEEEIYLPFNIVGFEELKDEQDMNVMVSIFNCRKRCVETDGIKRSKLTAASLQLAIIRHHGIAPVGEEQTKLKELVERKINQLLLKAPASIWSEAHKKIGFVQRDDILEFDSAYIYRNNQKISSRYYGRFDIAPKGSIEKIKEMFNTLIANSSPAVPIIALGAASTVLSFSNAKWDTNFNNPIIHLLGTSSKGKSTLAMLLSSFGGNPEGKKGFFLTFLATVNSILKKIGDVAGYTFTIDEFSTAAKNQDWSSLIYALANGVDKERCTAGGAALQEAAQFSGFFIATGENSIAAKCNKNEGIAGRLFEIVMPNFSTDATEADMIMSVAKKNYALLTPMIAEQLMNHSEDYKQLREEWAEKIKGRMNTDSITMNIKNRVVNYLSIIMTAVIVLKDVLKLNMNVAAIYDFYYSHFVVYKAEDSSLDVLVYERIKTFVCLNKNKFAPIMLLNGVPPLAEWQVGYEADLSHQSPQYRHKDISGEYYDFLYIFPKDLLEEYLSKYAFNDPAQAMRSLLDKKLLKYSRSGRATYELKMEVGSLTTYAVWFKEPSMSLDDVQQELLNSD